MTPFQDFQLRLVSPPFDSKLTDLVMDMQYLKRFQLQGETPPYLFFQLKAIFHLLESFASARIEGNRTTIDELVEATISPSENPTERIVEINNIDKAMELVDGTVTAKRGITKALILELHKTVVADLSVEGDPRPGRFRKKQVKISGSNHVPPDYAQVESYMDELITFINAPHDDKYDLLRTALVHHRFAWIHPFENGNGRVVRLITYAMLIDRGFRGLNLNEGRILNPSAVFCTQREKYYSMLSRADTGTSDGLLMWCEFMLEGLRDELVKIDRLLDYQYLRTGILLPALEFSKERNLLSAAEHRALVVGVKQGTFKAADLEMARSTSPETKSRFIAEMKRRELVMPLKPKGRIYILSLARGPLLKGIVQALGEEGFVSLEKI